MSWQSGGTAKRWKTCWKWGFIPYPCRKTVKVSCCTGIKKVECYGAYGQVWFCCDGKEYSWWEPCWGIGETIAESIRECRESIPSAVEGCPNAVGDAPPPYKPHPSRLGQSALIGIASAVLIGGITYLASAEISQTIINTSVGLVFGIGLGIGKRNGFLVSMGAVVVAITATILHKMLS